MGATLPNPAAAIHWGQIVFCSVLVAVGLVMHFVSKMKELEDIGQAVAVRVYLAAHRWNTTNTVLSAYGLLLLAYFTGEMGPVGSFCMGVAADVAGAKLRARAQAKLDSQPNVPPGA